MEHVGSNDEVTGAEPGQTIFAPLDTPLLQGELCISGIELRLDPLDKLGRWTNEC